MDACATLYAFWLRSLRCGPQHTADQFLCTPRTHRRAALIASAAPSAAFVHCHSSMGASSWPAFQRPHFTCAHVHTKVGRGAHARHSES